MPWQSDQTCSATIRAGGRPWEGPAAQAAVAAVRITAKAAGTTAIYVQGVKVDGKASSKTWLPESFAMKGGRLEFDLGTAPEKTWGVGKGDEPPSFEAR